MTKYRIKNPGKNLTHLGVSINNNLFEYLNKVSDELDINRSKLVEKILYDYLKSKTDIVRPDTNLFEEKQSIINVY